jgi:glycosyltransferase involved in cell wall biosynthesis
MKISGFTFVRNAEKYGYPLVESVKSLLPLVDEMVICAGNSEDNTNQLIESIGDKKIKIIHSVWNEKLRKGGEVLAVETNKAMDATSPDSDWLFYLQADEVLHEKYYDVIRETLQRYHDDKDVEGLLFHYHHFYGSFRFIADGRKWYSKEIRVIRNDRKIRSYRDAQGFRKNERKLKVKLVDAYVYHYGWVRNPLVMHTKVKDFGKLWNDDEVHETWAREFSKKSHFDYSLIDSVSLFQGTHPEVMKALVDQEDWEFDHDVKAKNFKNAKHRFLYFLWKRTGWRPFEYRNYKKI